MFETRRAKECQRGTAGAEERAKEGGRVPAEGSDTRLGCYAVKEHFDEKGINSLPYWVWYLKSL